MKPLQLTIHPRPMYGSEPADLWDAYSDAMHEQQLIDHKRLTDAELAAEYWRADSDAGYAEERGALPNDPHWVGTWSREAPDCNDRQRALRRFATTPDYDEEQP